MRTLPQIVAVSCLMLAGCVTTDANRGGVSATDTAYTHPYSKFSFPKRIENFRFVGQHTYDTVGKDISVGYASPTPIMATVYVYPAPKNVALVPGSPPRDIGNALVEQEFEKCKQGIAKIYPDSRLLSEGAWEMVKGDRHLTGKKAVYSLSYNYGGVKRDSLSELYVFLMEPGTMFLVNERQYVEYRITYPQKVADLAGIEVSRFLSELDWPAK